VAALVAACGSSAVGSPSSGGASASPVATGAVAPIPSVAAALDPALLEGVWTGALQADRAYPITLRFVGCEVGAACGDNEYADPDDPDRVVCASELTLAEAQEGTFLLRQRMTFHPDACLATSLRITPAADGTLEVAEYGDLEAPPCCTGTVTRVSADARPTPLAVGGPIPGLGVPTAVTDLHGGVTQYAGEGFGALWIPLADSGEVVRVDTTTGAILARVRIGEPARTQLGDDPHAVAVADDGAWVAVASEDAIARIDPTSNTVTRSIPVGIAPYALAIDGRRAWVASFEDDAVALVDLDTGDVLATGSAAKPTGIAVGEGGVWVVEHRADRVLRLDPETLAQVAAIDYGGPGPNEACGFCVENVLVAHGGVWTADNHRRSVTRIDPARNRIEARIALPLDAWAVAAGDDRVWASQKDEGAPTDTWLVAEIEPATNKAVTHPVPAQSVMWAGDALWTAVPGRRGDILTRIDVSR
jgi:DNA-binding beta-propeller fold protein YncE